MDLDSPPRASSIKLTSPPIRLRADGKQINCFFFLYFHVYNRIALIILTINGKIDVHHRSSIDNERHYRRSYGHGSKRSRPLTDSGSIGSSRNHGESSHTFSYDEATLRQLLLEYVVCFV